MRNHIQQGDVLTLTAPAGGVVSGTGYQIGSLFIVAMVTAAAGASFAAKITGVFELPRDVADAAWNEGDRIYWDEDAGNATTAAGVDNLPIGSAAASALTAATVGNVRLDAVTQWPGANPSAESTATYDHADDVGANTAIAAAGVARQVFVFHEITETFAGTTTEPIVNVGYTSDDDAFANITTGAAGVQGFTTGVLPAGEPLLVTVTDGTGGSEAGKVKVAAIAVP